MLSRRLKLLGTSAVIAIATLAAGAASASAGVLASSAPNCAAQSLSKPFLPWLDVANYTPLSGASFEGSTSGWSLGSARVAAENESFKVGGPRDAKSLRIPAGESVTSPSICVGLQHPTIRFFAKRHTGGTLNLSTMRVNVLFENNLGLLNQLPIGVVPGSSNWQPTLPMTVIANLLALLPGEKTPVAFRFTPMLGGEWSIDDVYVDPYARR